MRICRNYPVKSLSESEQERADRLLLQHGERLIDPAAPDRSLRVKLEPVPWEAVT